MISHVWLVKINDTDVCLLCVSIVEGHLRTELMKIV